VILLARVACIQLLSRRRESPGDFLLRLTCLVEHATHDGAQLVVFPAYTAFAYLTLAHPEAQLYFGPGLAQGIRRIWSSYGASNFNDFLDFFKGLARKHGTYIVPGTMLTPTGKGVTNTAYLISPAGTTIGTQSETHLNRDERGSGFVSGDDLQVFATPLCNSFISSFDAVGGQSSPTAFLWRALNKLVYTIGFSRERLRMRFFTERR
jgi:predicted amidohydrolase